MTKYKNVFQPIKIGNTWLRNRIICSPTGMISANMGTHIPEEEAITFLTNHAKNGAAMVVLTGGNLFPIPEEDDSFIWDLYSDKGLNALGHMAELFHMYGAKCSMELFHAVGGVDDYAVCDGTILPNGKVGRQMPVEYMERLAQGYADSAENLMKAGFDGVLLHFGHGWPVAQFMSPLTNKRQDAYGGSVENRARLPMMIISAIRERVGQKMLIDVRMSISEFEEGGLTPEEAIAFIEIFQEKIDMVNASCGLHNPKWFTHTHPCGFLPPMPNAYLAKMVKDSGRIRIPVSAIGGIQDFETADQFLEEGGADLLYIGRAFIADEAFAKKGFEDRAEDIRPCIKCMRCHDSTVFERKFLCAVNPVIGMEHVLEKDPFGQTIPKKVAVIGGGPAGLQASLTAAERGHRVTLFEKEAELGGKLVFAKHVSFKYALDEYMNYMIRQVQRSVVEIRLNTQISPDQLKQEGFDVIITAMGAEPLVPPINGIESTIHALDIYGKEDSLPDSVLVVGGGQVGCETALHLAKLGKKVLLLEMQPELAPDASVTHRNELLYELCTEKNLTCETGAKVTEIREDGVVYEKLSGIWKIANRFEDVFGNMGAGAAGTDRLKEDCKTNHSDGINACAFAFASCVILSAGMRANEEASTAFFQTAPQVIRIGDCVRPGTVERAVKDGYYAAMRI